MSNNEMYIRMTETKISKLSPRLAVPTIITMLVISIYRRYIYSWIISYKESNKRFKREYKKGE